MLNCTNTTAPVICVLHEYMSYAEPLLIILRFSCLQSLWYLPCQLLQIVAGVDTMSTADVLAELAFLNPRNKRKGKGGRQPAMDPRLDPNVDPKKAKRILANRLSAARSKMKQKSHVEVSLQILVTLSTVPSDPPAGLQRLLRRFA